MGKQLYRGEVFRDEAGKWRWRIKAGNGRVVCCSGENFAGRYEARRALKGFLGKFGIVATLRES